MDLSICIVNYNTKRLLRDCLVSLFNDNPGRICFEVIVVDNSSSDGSVSMIQDAFPQVRLLINKENLGFAKANNQAMKKSRGRYILLLNSDTVVLPGAFEKMVGFLESTPKAGAVAPKLLNLDGTTQVGFNVRRLLSPKVTISHLLLLDKMFPQSKTIRDYRMLDWNHNDIREIEQPAASCFLVRREVIDNIGMMDEGFFAWYTDVDLCLRMKQAGWKIFYLPEAQVYHHGGQSTIGWKQADLLVKTYRDLLHYYQKHFEFPTYNTIKLLTIVGMLLRMAVVLFLPHSIHVKSNYLDLDRRKEALSAYWAVIKAC